MSSSRPGTGCLKGCLIALLLLLTPLALVGGYGAWFLWQGFRHDPVMIAVGEVVRRDGIAQAVLGSNIHITGVEGNFRSFVPGLGAHGDYVLDVEGSKASGTLAVDADVEGGKVHVNSMILTGPQGERYDLMHHTLRPAGTTSI